MCCCSSGISPFRPAADAPWIAHEFLNNAEKAPASTIRASLRVGSKVTDAKPTSEKKAHNQARERFSDSTPPHWATV